MLFYFCGLYFAISQNQKKIDKQLRFIKTNEQTTQYTFDGLFFDKITYPDKKSAKKGKAKIKHALKSSYHIKENKQKIILPDSTEIRKIDFYCKYHKKRGVFYQCYHKDGKYESLNIGIYRDKDQLQVLDTLATQIFSNTEFKSNEVRFTNNVLNFDNLKFEVDTTYFSDKTCGRSGFKTENGYRYYISLFDSKKHAEKYIEQNLINRKGDPIKNKYIVDLDDQSFEVYRFHSIHFVKQKENEKSKKTYTNFILSCFKYKNLYMGIITLKGYIYDKKELIIDNEFIDVLKQVYEENKKSAE